MSKVRKSLLAPKTPGSSKGENGTTAESGRCLDFIAMVDHAELADTSSLKFTEHVNHGGIRIFEMDNSVKSNVRHIGTEDAGDDDSDYCIAFFNRRTKKTEYRPVSFLRVAPRSKKEIEETGLLEGKQRRTTVNYSVNNSITGEEAREKRLGLTMDFGNAKKRKVIEASLRRKLDDESMSIMNESLIDNNNPNISNLDLTATDLNGSTKDISLLQTPESMIVPKMNVNAKSPADVFKLEDFFREEELPVFVMCGKNFFSTHSTSEKLCEFGAPKFVALRIVEAWRRGDLFAAASLKLLVLSLLYPRGQKFVTNVPVSTLDSIAHQIKFLIEPDFLHGRTNKEKKFVLEKRYKEKVFFHMFGLYFAMASPGSYNFPLSTLFIELQMGDNVAKLLLQKIGCAVQTATPDEQRTYGTVLMARFIGPVRTVIRKGGRGRGRLR